MTIENREQNMPIRERLKFLEHLYHLAMIDIDTENGELDNLLIEIQNTVRGMNNEPTN